MTGAQGQFGDERRTAASPTQCVWMQAGVVGYKLCDREFDCDRCPFDAALRGETSRDRRVREIERLYQKAEEILNRDRECGPLTHVGATMRDGGTLSEDFINELSDAQARELVRLFFPARQAGGRTAPHEVQEQRR
jgi:hypothetical protein